MPSVLAEFDLPVVMRDGTTLRADVYRPADGARHPVVVERGPYGKAAFMPAFHAFNPWRAAQRGFVVVKQDVRGRFASEGTFEPFAAEARDGRDTIAWASALDCSDGRVCMAGGSYLGATQWLAAADPHPALRAIMPQRTGWQMGDGWTHVGGVFQLGFVLGWVVGNLLPDAVRRGGDPRAISEAGRLAAELPSLYARTPLNRVPELVDDYAPYYRRWVEAAPGDPLWGAWHNERAWGSGVPALHVGGLHDIFLAGTLRNFARHGSRAPGGPGGSRATGGSRGPGALGAPGAPGGGAAVPRALLIGPWSHGNATGFFSHASPGAAGGADAIDLTAVQLAWLDGVLSGRAEPWTRVYQTGAGRWLAGPQPPWEGAREIALHLSSGGRANSLHGDGRLTAAVPGREPPDTFLYRPDDPVPTCGGATLMPGEPVSLHSGPKDQRGVEARPDVLVYTGDALGRDLDAIGTVRAVLHVATTAADTDFTVKLCDVHPDGRAINLADGILRMRYRGGLAGPVPCEPGRIHEVEVEVGFVCHRFLRGHRLRVEVGSSNFPRFSRNMNVLDPPETTPLERARTATQTLHHDGARPSRLLLPVVEA